MAARRANPRWPFRAAACAVAACLTMQAGQARAACRQALALGLDISGSVDIQEYASQMRGLAVALTDPQVAGAFLSMPGAPVRIMIYEWAGPRTQRVVIDWHDVTDLADLQAMHQTLASRGRARRDLPTALGRAMQFGVAELQAQSDCWQRTLDISGDGVSNGGPTPREVKRAMRLEGVTINGLVIGADAERGAAELPKQLADLSAYYQAEVIHGPDAFVQGAFGYLDYGRAMTRKLLRELSVVAIGDAGPDAGATGAEGSIQ